LKLTASAKSYRELLNRRQEIYTIEQRKFSAGATQKIEVTEAAIEIAETLRLLTDTQMRRQGVLKEISVLTRQDYDSESTEFMDFDISATTIGQRPEISRFPEIIAYDLEIRKKTAEFEMVDLERYPKLSLYADYKLYGRDDNNFYDSFQDLSRKNSSIGITIDLTLFQGFATVHKAGSLRKELEILQLERARKIAELTAQIDTLIENVRIFQESGTDRREYLENSAQLQEMARRLTEQQLTERLYFLRTQVDMSEKQLEIKLKEIDWAANSRRLLFLARESNS
jgi:outer membrane protein TolC